MENSPTIPKALLDLKSAVTLSITDCHCIVHGYASSRTAFALLSSTAAHELFIRNNTLMLRGDKATFVEFTGPGSDISYHSFTDNSIDVSLASEALYIYLTNIHASVTYREFAGNITDATTDHFHNSYAIFATLPNLGISIRKIRSTDTEPINMPALRKSNKGIYFAAKIIKFPVFVLKQLDIDSAISNVPITIYSDSVEVHSALSIINKNIVLKGISSFLIARTDSPTGNIFNIGEAGGLELSECSYAGTGALVTVDKSVSNYSLVVASSSTFSGSAFDISGSGSISIYSESTGTIKEKIFTLGSNVSAIPQIKHRTYKTKIFSKN